MFTAIMYSVDWEVVTNENNAERGDRMRAEKGHLRLPRTS